MKGTEDSVLAQKMRYLSTAVPCCTYLLYSGPEEPTVGPKRGIKSNLKIFQKKSKQIAEIGPTLINVRSNRFLSPALSLFDSSRATSV